MALDRLSDRIQQVTVAERLGEELDGACLHRPHRGRNIAVPGDEDDGNVEVDLRHPRLEIEPAQARQPDVEHQAAGNIRRRAGEELLRGREGLDLQPCRPDQTCQSLSNGVVVVHDEHGCSRLGHDSVYTLVGSVRENVAPRGELSEAHKRPPCDSTMERLIDSPIPSPRGLVVKNASKIWSRCGGRPLPVSRTVTRSCSFSVRCDFKASSRIPSTSFIASMPLRMRFIRTCCNWTRSPRTRGSLAVSSVRTEMEY